MGIRCLIIQYIEACIVRGGAKRRHWMVTWDSFCMVLSKISV